VTLLDSDKTLQEKTAETLQVAAKWERSAPVSQLTPSSVTDTAQPKQPSEPCVAAEVMHFIVNINLRSLFKGWLSVI